MSIYYLLYSCCLQLSTGQRIIGCYLRAQPFANSIPRTTRSLQARALLLTVNAHQYGFTCNRLTVIQRILLGSGHQIGCLMVVWRHITQYNITVVQGSRWTFSWHCGVPSAGCNRLADSSCHSGRCRAGAGCDGRGGLSLCSILTHLQLQVPSGRWFALLVGISLHCLFELGGLQIGLFSYYMVDLTLAFVTFSRFYSTSYYYRASSIRGSNLLSLNFMGIALPFSR